LTPLANSALFLSTKGLATSKRRKSSTAVLDAPAAAETAPAAGPEMLRRTLLGVVVALLTARAVAPGEDAGLLNTPPATLGLVVTFLWLAAVVGAAVWSVWSRRGGWRFGLVEAALLIAVVVAFVSAEAASYKHPARLIAWEWLALLAAFCLVRLLADDDADRRALFAVFLANAAALAVQGVIQALGGGAAKATYARPETFASWLALFVPGLIAAAVLCRPGRAPRWQGVLSLLLALLGVGAAGAATFTAFTPAGAEAPLLERWRVTAAIVLDRPWLGVGAGNFGDAYPKFMGPNDLPVATSAVFTDANPHNFALELWTTGGVFLLLAVGVALTAFFFRAFRGWARRDPEIADDEPRRVGWEYYLGGMFGLVLGFGVHLFSMTLSGEDIIREGAISGARCLVWFAALALYERVAWTAQARIAALTLGVAALLIALTVSGGIGASGVALALWAAIALTLNELPAGRRAWVPAKAIGVLFAGAAAVLLVYFLLVFNPVVDAAFHGRKANELEARFRAMEREPGSRRLATMGGVDATKLLVEAAKAGERARQADPDDARHLVALANVKSKYWLLLQGAPRPSVYAFSDANLAQTLRQAARDGYEAEYKWRMEYGRRLEEPPPSVLGLAIGATYRAHLRANAWDDPDPPNWQGKDWPRRQEQYRLAAEALDRYLPHSPNDSRLRWRIAEAYYKAGEEIRWRKHAEVALRLDEAATRPQRKLEDGQRERLRRWLGSAQGE
jgi:O-antigen ligase